MHRGREGLGAATERVVYLEKRPIEYSSSTMQTGTP